MKVFMSWSGARSRAAAELLCDWIKCVIQVSNPWISTRHIDRGALWFSEIHNELKDTSVGIVCLTHENKDKPWILFVAGALAKGLSSNRVCTFLVDLEPSHLEDPLAQFNATLPNKEGVFNLIMTLNANVESNRLDLRVLETVFETYWPQFEAKFCTLLENLPQKAVIVERPGNEILADILENTRNMGQRLRNLESNTSIVKKGLTATSALAPSASLPLQRTAREEMLVRMREMGMDGVPVHKIVQQLEEQGFPPQPLRKYASLMDSDLAAFTAHEIFSETGRK